VRGHVPDDTDRVLRFHLVTTFYPPWNHGGDGIVVRRLARALTRRGHEVTVVHDPLAYEITSGPPADPAYDDDPRIGHRPVRSGSGRLGLIVAHQTGRPLLRAGPLKEAIEEGDPDVVHFHNVSLLGGPGVLRFGGPVRLCTLHDYWFVCGMHVLWRFDREACTRRTCLACTVAGGRPPQPWRATGTLERAIAEVDTFLTGTAFARDRHHEHGFPAPIDVLPAFVPEDQIAPTTREPAPDMEPYALFVGRLESYKGVLELVRAFRRVRGLRLLVAGEGTLETKVRQLAGESRRVEVLGALDRSRLVEAYRGATAVVVPSLCYETFGLVAIEALAQGTPVIVREGTALEEIVEKTGGGVTYRTEDDLLDRLETLLARPTERHRMGEEGRRAVRRDFSETAHLDRYLDLVRRLLARHHDRHPAPEVTDG